jgi:hypothetical protein
VASLTSLASRFAAPNRVWIECFIRDADLQEAEEEDPATCDDLRVQAVAR